MKKLGAQLHKIVAAALALVIALGVASFACYAWFTSSKEVNSDGITATVDEAFITNYEFTAYPLTETSTSSTYTQGSAIEANKDDTSKNYGYYEIGEYGTSTSATLLVISYTVRGGSATKLTFSGNAFTTPSYDETTGVITTDLSNAVSLRLGALDGITVTSSNVARLFYDITANGVDQDVVFNNVEADEENKVTLYIIMEYDDDNVSALYDMCGASLSASLSLTKDITLSIEPYDSAEDHEHTYSKWTVTDYTGTGSYDYTATRTCTSCTSAPAATQTVNFNSSDITETISGSIVMATIYDTDETTVLYYIVFNTYSSSDSGSTSTATVTGVSLSASTASLTVGGSTLELTATVTMSNSSTYSGTVTWKSSDESVATVDSNGKVTGVAVGSATITATAGDESATCTVTVSAAATVSKVEITGDTTVAAGNSITLSATVTMSNSSTYSGTVTWTSGDTDIATVDSSGTVTGVAAGNVTITATADGVEGTYTVLIVSATATAHTSTFSISELVAAIETRTSTTISDNTQLATTDFTGSNAFLTLQNEDANNKYRTNNNGVIEIKGDGLSVTFTGTGTITISFASTGSSNISSLGLKNSDGDYVTNSTTNRATPVYDTDDTTVLYYTVTGSSTYVTVTFTVTKAGTYYIATNVGDENRGARISAISMIDYYE